MRLTNTGLLEPGIFLTPVVFFLRTPLRTGLSRGALALRPFTTFVFPLLLALIRSFALSCASSTENFLIFLGDAGTRSVAPIEREACRMPALSFDCKAR